jgi:MFS family permease
MDRQLGQRRSLVLASIGHFVNDGTTYFVPVIAAILATRPGVSPGFITALFLVFYVSTAAASPLVGRLADRRGRAGMLMGLGLATLSLGLLTFYVALEVASGLLLDGVLLLAALLTGAGAAFYHPLGGTLIQTAFAGRRMGLALGINGALGSLGRALYPSLYFLAALAIAGYGAIALFSLLGFAAAAVILVGMRVARAPAGEQQPAPADRGVAPGETATDVPEAQAVVRPAGGGGLRGALTFGIIVLTAVAFLRATATQGIAAWIPTYLATQGGLGVSAGLGLAVTIMYAAAIIGQPLFGLMVDRFDRRWILALSSLGSVVSILGYLSFSGAGLVGEAWLFAFGFFTFSGFPQFLSLVRDYVPPGSSSLANAMVWGVGSTTGNAIGPVLIGALAGGVYENLGFAFTVAASAAVLSALGTMLLRRPDRVAATPSA